MNGYVGAIESFTSQNSYFRQVLYTSTHLQLVLMSLAPNEEIGSEVHQTIDQFFRIEEGQGKVILNGEEQVIKPGDAVIIPAGVEHNVINTSSSEALKLYTIYTPPDHRDGVVHKTKAEALADTTDHFE